MIKKNKSKAILIILLLLIAFIVYDKKTPIALAGNYYIATADLNVRTGAGTRHAVLFTLQKGDEVEVLSKKKKWFKIRHQDKTGYAYSKYLAYSRIIPTTIPQTSEPLLAYIVVGIFALVILSVVFSIIRREPHNKPLKTELNYKRDIRSKRGIEFKHSKTVTNLNRGTRSERALVFELMKYGIPEQMIFHDLYLKKYEGHFSQIDLVVVSKVGVIVIEVKEYGGWIYGTGNQQQWTQVLAQGKQKYLFQNPIRQNQGHMAALRRKINCYENIPFYSIVVFYGDCVLKNVKFIPEGTFITKSERVFEALDLIMKNNEPFQYSNKPEVVRILKEAVGNGEHLENQIQHIENVKEMLGTNRILD